MRGPFKKNKQNLSGTENCLGGKARGYIMGKNLFCPRLLAVDFRNTLQVVLVSAGIELIGFLVAGVVLCLSWV